MEEKVNEGRLDELKKFYGKLEDHKLETEKEFPKVILLVSGGALTVSLTFSDSVASLSNPFMNIFLIGGWILLLLTISLQLYFYRKVASSSQVLLDKLDRVLAKTEPEEGVFTVYVSKMKKLTLISNISVFTMAIGLVCVSVFFSVNIILKSSNNKPNDFNSRNTGQKGCKENNQCVPSINIENNPVFINNNNGKTDSIKEIIKTCNHKPCR